MGSPPGLLDGDRLLTTREVADKRLSRRPPASDRLANSDAVLARSDLAELGYERRVVDAIFRACPVEPLIRASAERIDALALSQSAGSATQIGARETRPWKRSGQSPAAFAGAGCQSSGIFVEGFN